MQIWTITTDTDGQLETAVAYTEGAANLACKAIMIGNWKRAERDLGEFPEDWRDAYQMMDERGDMTAYVTLEHHDLSQHPFIKHLINSLDMLEERIGQCMTITTVLRDRVKYSDPDADPWGPVHEQMALQAAVDDELKPGSAPVENDDSYMSQCVDRSAPRWAWDIIDETLAADAKSSAFSEDLRTSVENATIAMAHACESSADEVTEASIESMRAEATYG